MKEGWMKSDEGWMKSDEGWMMKDEGWMMQYDDFKLLRGFDLWQTDERTDICDCRVAFATEKLVQELSRQPLFPYTGLK